MRAIKVERVGLVVKALLVGAKLVVGVGLGAILVVGKY